MNESLAQLLSSLKGLFVPFLPFIIYKLVVYIQKARVSYAARTLTPVSAANWRIMAILAAAVLIQVSVYPLYATPMVNVFTETNSRMQTSGEVLGARLRELYGIEYETAPNSIAAGGTWDYELLLTRLVSAEGRALYAIYGTDAYAGCQWCRTDQPSGFFTYILPSIVMPHFVNFLPLLLVTSGGDGSFSISTPNSRQWFFLTVVSAGFLVLYEIYTYYQAPTSQTVLASIKTPLPENIYWMYWECVKLRAVAMAGLDAILACLIFLSASGRAFDSGESTSVRTARVIDQLSFAVSKLRLSVLLHSNVISRMEESRNAYTQWGANAEKIETLTRSLPEVMEARKQAKTRVPSGMRQLEIDAAVYVDKLFEVA